MKHILLLTTGGTIASRPSAEGLAPAEGIFWEERLGALRESYRIERRALLNLDSSNIQPEEWQLMARAVYAAREEYDGVVISHGTDTMAYTASMLTFMLPGIPL
ncbi:MAG: asparaginase domain-containing protein, partial [bacterium]